MILDKIKLCRDAGKSRNKTITPRESRDAKFTGNEKFYWASTFQSFQRFKFFQATSKHFQSFLYLMEPSCELFCLAPKFSVGLRSSDCGPKSSNELNHFSTYNLSSNYTLKNG